MSYELTLRGLRALVAIAETGSIKLAAERMHVTQPAISQRVAQLSDVFGGAVVERDGRGVRLTERGVIVVAHARDVERCLTEALEVTAGLSKLSRGRIRIGVLQSVNLHLVPAVLAELAVIHPAIRTLVLELTGAGIEEAVVSGDLDFGIGIGRVQHEELRITPIYSEKIL